MVGWLCFTSHRQRGHTSMVLSPIGGDNSIVMFEISLLFGLSRNYYLKLSKILNSNQVIEGENVGSSNEEIVAAEFVSFNEIQCKVATSGGYYVRVSNQGNKATDDRLLQVNYDSVCFQCDVKENSTSCTKKVG